MSGVADRDEWDVELMKIFAFHKILELKVNYSDHLIQSNLWIRNRYACPFTQTLRPPPPATCEWLHSYRVANPGLEVSWHLYSSAPCCLLRIYIKHSLTPELFELECCVVDQTAKLKARGRIESGGSRWGPFVWVVWFWEVRISGWKTLNAFSLG